MMRMNPKAMELIRKRIQAEICLGRRMDALALLHALAVLSIVEDVQEEWIGVLNSLPLPEGYDREGLDQITTLVRTLLGAKGEIA